jgi:transcriptional regulator with XRE-family HTH domain
MSADVQHTRTLSDQVAEEIRVALARQRISGRELARKLEVSPNWVSLRITGAQAIALNDLEKIAAALGVDALDPLPREPRERTSRYLPGEHVLTTVGQPADQTDGVRRPVKLRRPNGTRPSVRPTTPTAA